MKIIKISFVRLTSPRSEIKESKIKNKNRYSMKFHEILLLFNYFSIQNRKWILYRVVRRKYVEYA